MDDLKQLAAVTAINHMLTERHFSICTIDKVGNLLNVKPAGDAYNILSSVHCMDYAKMPAQLREAIPSLIQSCLGVETIFQFADLKQKVIDLNTVTPQKPGLLRVLGFGK